MDALLALITGIAAGGSGKCKIHTFPAFERGASSSTTISDLTPHSILLYAHTLNHYDHKWYAIHHEIEYTMSMGGSTYVWLIVSHGK